MTQHIGLVLVGFGNVGRALARLLMRKRGDLENQFGITFQINGIATGRHGMAINPDGIFLPRALELMEHGESLNALSTTIPANRLPPTCAWRWRRVCTPLPPTRGRWCTLTAN
jgi:homoserine dehydrogenase